MAANRERLRELADACVELAAETEDPDSIGELLRISYRLLSLADPTLPQGDSAGEFGERGAASH